MGRPAREEQAATFVGDDRRHHRHRRFPGGSRGGWRGNRHGATHAEHARRPKPENQTVRPGHARQKTLAPSRRAPILAAMKKPAEPLVPNPLDRMRARRERPRIHPTEKAVLALVATHLAILPWALGAMHLPAQITSAVLAVAAMAVALVPRTYRSDESGREPFRLVPGRRLLRFPVFWLGLALLGYVLLQAINPVWAHTTDGKVFWMTRVPGSDWLPPGVQVPFEKWGPWRVFMVFGAAWLTACAIWVGFTRRRTLQILVGVLAANGLLVALLGVAQRMTRTNLIYWNVDFPGAMTFGPFVYKNHGRATCYCRWPRSAGWRAGSICEACAGSRSPTPAACWLSPRPSSRWRS